VQGVCQKCSPSNTEQPEKNCAKLIQRSEKDGDAFLSRIIIGDETWIHHYDPLTSGINSRRHAKKSRCKLLRLKSWLASPETVKNIFWEFLERGTTVISDIKVVKQPIRRFRPNMKLHQVFLLHNNTRLLISLCTREAVVTMGWTVHPHPPYSPDFAYCDFYIFGSLQDALQECRCAVDELKYSLPEGMRRFSEEFYTTGIQLLTQR